MKSKMAIVSIHPVHVENILNGTKAFEYRKIIPKQNITHIAIYCTAPIKKIVAVAEIVGRIVDSPNKVWLATSYGAGISWEFFKDYFCGKNIANALVLGNVYKMSNPIDLAELNKKGVPPQSFYYVNDDGIKIIEQRQSLKPSSSPPFVFVGGIHGVGKSTICQKLFAPAGYKCVTASSLISLNGNEIDNSKRVKNINDNQSALLKQLNTIKSKFNRLLLDGHYTLVNESGKIELISFDVFRAMKPNALFLVKSNPQEIAQRLQIRDGKVWKVSFIKEFQKIEETHAQNISKKIGIPLRIFSNDESMTTSAMEQIVLQLFSV